MQTSDIHVEEQRPAIPHPIKRTVRQRCCFGCVICGLPIYEYHHMVPYSEVREHNESNLTLLCDFHHREVTVGLLPPATVAAANQSPYGAVHGVSSPYALHLSGNQFNVEIGSNHFTGGALHPDGGFTFIPFSVDDIDILWFRVDENGKIFFYMNILDECNLPILTIQANELTYKTDSWDIVFEGTKLAVRQAARDIFLEINFCPPSGIQILQGRLLCNGVEIIVRKTHIFIVNTGTSFRNCEFRADDIGLQIGRNERGYKSIVRLNPQSIKRYGVDRKAALEVIKEMRRNFEALLDKGR